MLASKDDRSNFDGGNIHQGVNYGNLEERGIANIQSGARGYTLRERVQRQVCKGKEEGVKGMTWGFVRLGADVGGIIRSSI